MEMEAAREDAVEEGNIACSYNRVEDLENHGVARQDISKLKAA
jgi:hypothetical protein